MSETTIRGVKKPRVNHRRRGLQDKKFAMHVDEHNLPCKMVMRDNDKKYPKTFDDVFTTSPCKIKRNLQSHVERVVQTLKHEVLNGFCVVSERHMDHILRRAADWYNHRRCNSAPGKLPPVRDEFYRRTDDCHKRKYFT